MSIRSTGGEKYPLDDKSILAIDSPKKRISELNKVIYVDKEDRYAIVAMKYDENPTFGIRWFWNTCGYPNSRGYPTWLVCPNLIKQILKTHNFSIQKVSDFLAGKKVDW